MVANYTLGVVAHVDRQTQIDRLHDIVNPDLVMVDDGSLGVMGNHTLTIHKLYDNMRRCGAEWMVVLEDDAQPPETGFHQQLSAALDVAPTRIVSLYNGTGHPSQRQARFTELSQRQDVHWIMWKYLRHAVAYALHVDIIEMGLVDHMVEYSRQRWAPDDAISKFARRWDTTISYSNPSLVNHEDGPAMVKGRTAFGITTLARRRPRRAHWVGTRMSWTDRSADI